MPRRRDLTRPPQHQRYYPAVPDDGPYLVAVRGVPVHPVVPREPLKHDATATDCAFSTALRYGEERFSRPLRHSRTEKADSPHLRVCCHRHCARLSTTSMSRLRRARHIGSTELGRSPTVPAGSRAGYASSLHILDGSYLPRNDWRSSPCPLDLRPLAPRTPEDRIAEAVRVGEKPDMSVLHRFLSYTTSVARLSRAAKGAGAPTAPAPAPRPSRQLGGRLVLPGLSLFRLELGQKLVVDLIDLHPTERGLRPDRHPRPSVDRIGLRRCGKVA